MGIAGEKVGDAEKVGGGSAQSDQYVHVGAAVAQGGPGAAIERPAGDELHRGGQGELHIGVHQDVRQVGQDGGHMQDHPEQQRERQCGRQEEAPPLAAHFRLPQLFFPVDVAGIGRIVGFVTQFFHFGLDLLEAQFVSAELDSRPLRGQVHGGAEYSRQRVQGFFDPGGASRAAHAGDFEFDLIGSHLIAEIGHFGREIFQAGLGRVIDDTGRFGGKVDYRFRYARQFAKAFFDAGRAGGAGHADDFQCAGAEGSVRSIGFHQVHFL